MTTSLDVSVFVYLLLHEERLSLFRSRLDLYLSELWAPTTPVRVALWLEHFEAIRRLPQHSVASVYRFIKHVNDLRDYFRLDLSDALILILGLIPPDWKPQPEFVGWSDARPTTSLSCVCADDDGAVWSMIKYLVYILYNQTLRTCRDFYSEVDVTLQMRQLMKLNPKDSYLSTFIYPFIN